MRNSLRLLLALALSSGLTLSCASRVLKYDKADELKDIKEFDSSVNIVLPVEAEESAKESSTADAAAAVSSTPVTTAPQKTPKKVTAKKTESAAAAKTAKPTRRQPEIEDDKGFDGRRPIKDPFRVGEKVVHDVSYFKMSAGKLTMEVKPFGEVNGKKSYNFRTAIATSSLFSSFYSVDDHVTTLVDFETLIPSVFTLHVKETSQLREARMLINGTKATFWEKKVTKKDGEQQKKVEWDVNPYAQNLYSIAFYLRNFQWDVGVEHKFHVGDAGKNLVFKAKGVRKERISTDVGDFDTIVIRPEIELEGKFKQIGDNFLWLSDDDRKFILRIESKIKIGTLVSEIVELKKGSE